MSDKNEEKRKVGVIVVNNKIIITIPPIISDSMKCLKYTSANDVSASYNVMLYNNKNQRLYVNNVEDFREVLKQFYIYKKLCSVIQYAITTSKLKVAKECKCIACIKIIEKISADKKSLSTISEKTSQSQDVIKKKILDEAPEMSTSAAVPLKESFIDTEPSIHDNEVITCHGADESIKCETIREEPCPASCSQGVYLETLPDGKRLLRKKGCCVLM